MDVLVIGGTGNLSSDYIEALSGAGHHVALLNRGSKAPPAGAEQLTADRNDAAGVAAALGERRFDVAIDFLCFSPDQMTSALALIAPRCGQWIFISSATVYRKPHELPVREDHPLGNDASQYARDKQACEELLRTNCPVPWTIVRPSHTFSRCWIPSPLHGFDYTVTARILAGKPIIVHDEGHSLWALTASEDFAQALLGLTGNARAHGRAVHITTDEVRTWNGIYQELAWLLKATPEIVHIPTSFLCQHDPAAEGKLAGDKAHHGLFDNQLIRELVPGWQCEFNLHRSLKRSLDWFAADPARQHINTDADAAIDAVISAWRSV